ncbi:MAG: response regulator [Eubacteriales bacterium]
MYKVLIADDEMIIRSELAKAFDWQLFGMEIVGLAKNGLEALDMVETLKPDICLLDVNMPFINGLELIEKISITNKDIINVIISGHDEFQYAQKAVHLGVYDYVLKPIDEDSFVEMLRKIKVKLDQSENSRHHELLSNAIMKESKEQLQNEFLIRWLHGEKQQQEINEGLDYFHITLPANIGLVLIKLNIPVGIAENDAAKASQFSKCQKLLYDYLKKDTVICSVNLRADCILLLISVSDIVVWNRMGRKIEQQLYTSIGLQVKVFKNLVPDGAMSVPAVFKLTENELKTESGYLPLVKKIKQYVEINYEDSQLRLQNFANDNQISISYLSKIFKQETGVVFIDYLIKFRIMKSLELLEQSSLKISEISEVVGYSSQHYYCEAFKKVMGMAPTEYRRRGNKKTEGAFYDIKE